MTNPMTPTEQDRKLEDPIYQILKDHGWKDKDGSDE